MSESSKNKPGIVISTPFRIVDNGIGGARLQHVTPEWHRARLRLQIPFGWGAIEVGCDGHEIGEARCRVAKKAIEIGADFLFFHDCDVLVPPNALKQLMFRLTASHTEYDVASGIYTNKGKPTVPLIFREWDRGPCWDCDSREVIAPVVGVPMGCTLLRLSLFDRLPKDLPWFKTHDLSEGNPFEMDDDSDLPIASGTITEDLWLCKLCERAGVKILADSSVQCGHQDLETGEVFELAKG